MINEQVEGVTCQLCKTDHAVENYEKLAQQTLEERVDFLRKERICFVCFQHGHIAHELPIRNQTQV